MQPLTDAGFSFHPTPAVYCHSFFHAHNILELLFFLFFWGGFGFSEKLNIIFMHMNVHASTLCTQIDAWISVCECIWDVSDLDDNLWIRMVPSEAMGCETRQALYPCTIPAEPQDMWAPLCVRGCVCLCVCLCACHKWCHRWSLLLVSLETTADPLWTHTYNIIISIHLQALIYMLCYHHASHNCSPSCTHDLFHCEHTWRFSVMAVQMQNSCFPTMEWTWWLLGQAALM